MEKKKKDENIVPRKKMQKIPRVVLVVMCVIILICIIGLAVYLFHMFKTWSDFRGLSAQVQKSQAETEQPQSMETEILPQYEALHEQNQELFGWIRIDGTVIDYPVMYTPNDPEKYLHTNFKGEYSYGGIPFLDAACSADSDNIIIYGHNLIDGSMFHSLLKYQEKAFWQEHPTIYFDTLYEEGEYEVLAAFYDRVYYQSETCFKFYQFINAADEEEFNNAISNYRQKQLYDTGVTAVYGDRLITLVTCAYHVENGRFVVVARKK